METLYDANGSIELTRTVVKLVDGPSCQVQVVLRLSPAPWIHFDLLDPSLEFQMALMDAFMEDRPTVIGLPSGENVQVLESNQSLIPISGPVQALDAGKPMHTVRFGVINFPDFIKPRSPDSQTDGETRWSIEDLRTIRLVGGPWLLELSPVGNRKEVHRSLRQQRGFALTHWGRVARLDGKPFLRRSVQPLMAILNLFLSFARGVSCGTTLIRGFDKAEETVWEEWGVSKVQPWRGYSSCLDRVHGEALERLFPGFWSYLRALPQDSQTVLALEWYLESNTQEALHTSIVLSQAALERLTFETLERGKTKEETRGDWMASALSSVQADVTVPASSGMARGKKSPKHGPHALVDLRNDLVHPKMKNSIPCAEAQRHARELGLWYVELLLLKRFGYNGLYSNRLTRKWIGDVEMVPWASIV